jgi:coenzyme F420 hydrogenase subunit beta
VEIFGKEPENSLESILLGNYLNCYAGYSTDHNLRFNSSSGGLVTQLLISAFEEDMIDGALVTKMNSNNPLEPQPFIARTREEILEASRSKYCPVPANVALQEIMRKDGKYAVVGLPCHIHGLRKVAQLNGKLKERIVLHLGLFCSRNDSFWMTRYLLYRLGVEANDIAKIDYRGKGWPGMLSIKLRSGSEIDWPLKGWMGLHNFCVFTLSRCLLCCDGTAELADVSFGDAWLPEFREDRVGRSIIVSRSLIGERFLQRAVSCNKAELKELSAGKVIKSQGMMRFKKNSVQVRFLIFRLRGKQVPVYTSKLLKPNFIDCSRSIAVFLNQYFLSRPRFWGNIESLEGLQNSLEKIYTCALGKK